MSNGSKKQIVKQGNGPRVKEVAIVRLARNYPEKYQSFLTSLKAGSSIASACGVIGMSPKGVYTLLNRAKQKGAKKAERKINRDILAAIAVAMRISEAELRKLDPKFYLTHGPALRLTQEWKDKQPVDTGESTASISALDIIQSLVALYQSGISIDELIKTGQIGTLQLQPASKPLHPLLTSVGNQLSAVSESQPSLPPPPPSVDSISVDAGTKKKMKRTPIVSAESDSEVMGAGVVYGESSLPSLHNDASNHLHNDASTDSLPFTPTDGSMDTRICRDAGSKIRRTPITRRVLIPSLRENEDDQMSPGKKKIRRVPIQSTESQEHLPDSSIQLEPNPPVSEVHSVPNSEVSDTVLRESIPQELCKIVDIPVEKPGSEAYDQPTLQIKCVDVAPSVSKDETEVPAEEPKAKSGSISDLVKNLFPGISGKSVEELRQANDERMNEVNERVEHLPESLRQFLQRG